MPEYTVAATGAVALVIGAELLWFRTGIFASRVYWIAMAICLFFMILTNGWLTKLSAPVVNYDPRATTGVRVPFDIPVEDFLFGFTLLTFVIVLWRRSERTNA